MERKALIAARNKKHLTQDQVARLVGVDRATVQRWEKGISSPRGYNLTELCKLYEASLVDLGLEEDRAGIVPMLPPSALQELTNTNLTVCLMRVALVPHKSFQVLQNAITKVIEEFDVMDKERAKITRREALQGVAMLPILSLQIHNVSAALRHPIEDVLTQCSASIASLWELSRSDDGNDLAFAFRGAAAHLPVLKTIIKDSVRHRQAAASLVGQCELLRTVLGWHLLGANAATQYAQEAVRYCIEAGDTAMLLSTLDYQSWVYYYDNKPRQALSVIEQTVPIIKRHHDSLSLQLLSGIYSTLAVMRVHNNQDEEKYSQKAEDAYNARRGNDMPFASIDYGKGDIMLNKGMVYFDQRAYGETIEVLSQLVDPETLQTKMPLSPRSSIEAINIMSLALLKSENKDMEKTLHLWDAAANGARHLQSEQRFREVRQNYEIMDALWPGEKRITERRELAMHW